MEKLEKEEGWNLKEGLRNPKKKCWQLRKVERKGERNLNETKEIKRKLPNAIKRVTEKT